MKAIIGTVLKNVNLTSRRRNFIEQVQHTFLFLHNKYYDLLHLSVSIRGVIGQFCGPYFTVRPAKLQRSLLSRAPDRLTPKI